MEMNTRYKAMTVEILLDKLCKLEKHAPCSIFFNSEYFKFRDASHYCSKNQKYLRNFSTLFVHKTANEKPEFKLKPEEKNPEFRLKPEDWHLCLKQISCQFSA